MYDDEYDDSFDDLIAFGADGVTEMEGEEGGPAGPAGASRGGAAAGPSMASAQRAMQGLSLQPGAASFQPAGGAAAAGPAPGGGGRPQQPPLSTKKTKGSKLWVSFVRGSGMAVGTATVHFMAEYGQAWRQWVLPASSLTVMKVCTCTALGPRPHHPWPPPSFSHVLIELHCTCRCSTAAFTITPSLGPRR